MEMTIQVNEPGTKAFYKQAVNVTLQSGRLLKKPTCRIKNLFLQYTVLTAASALALALWCLIPFLRQSKEAVLAIAALAVCLLISGALLFSFYRLLFTMQSSRRPSCLTLDEGGLELKKEGENALRCEWKSVAFVRVLPQGICVVLKAPLRVALHVQPPYGEQVLRYLAENRPEVAVIGK